MNLSDRRYFQDVLDSRNPLGVEAVFGRLTGAAVLQVACAARHETGEIKFVLLASLNLEKIMQSHWQRSRPGAVIALVDSQGIVLSWNPDGDRLRGTSIAGSPLFDFARAGQSGQVRDDVGLDGTIQIWAANRLSEFPAAGLHVLVGLSKQDVLAAANRNLIQALAILLAVSVMVIGGAWLLARGAMEREIAERQRIRELNERLERRVLERTARLEGVNQALTREIAEREQADRRVQAQRQRAEALLEGAPDPVVIVDHAGRIAIVNARTEIVFGYPRAELIGQAVEMLIPEQSRATHAAPREWYHRSPSAREMGAGSELFARRRDGTVFAVDVSLSPMSTPEGTLIISTIRDVTDRRRTEDLLRQAQKMEAIGNLTGGMAHDFNNFLGVIIGNLDLARRQVDGNEDLAEMIGEALEAAWHGADLTRRLLAFARQQPLQPKCVNVNDLVTNIIRLLSRTLGENIEISLNLAAHLPPTVIDPAQLEASLVNLANNARDAMPSGGKLKITTASRHIDADYAAQHAEVTAGDYVSIEVSDTGAGMPPEVLSRIFEPFFTTKEPGRGTGLGLSMVFGFVKQSGGHISVYSEPGTGTTFRLFLLPATEDVAAAGESVVPHVVRRGGGETILVVDDKAPLRRVAMRQLRELGYRVLEAENATAALELMDRQNVDLLFTDVVMPGGTDGVELARQARQRRPALKVVLTSGFAEAHMNGSSRPLPPDAPLLTKPYRREELAAVVRAELER